MIVILHGSFHGDNFGDTLLLKSFYDYIKRKHPSHNVLATNTSDHALQFCQLQPISKTQALADKNNRIIFCGGGYFGEPNENVYRWSLRLFKRHLLFAIGARYRGIPYAVLGVGLGPLSKSWARNPTVNVVRGARFCALRDQESIDYLSTYDRSIKPIRVADAILSHTSSNLLEMCGIPPTLKTYSSRKKVILHIPGNSENSNVRKLIVDALVAALDVDSELEIVAVTDGHSRNQGIPDFFRWILDCSHDRVRVVRFVNPKQLLMEISDSYSVITSKLHVGICSAVLNKRILAFPKHSKTMRFYKQLERNEICIPLDKLDTSKISILINQMLSGESQPVAVPDILRQDARAIWNCIDLFLE